MVVIQSLGECFEIIIVFEPAHRSNQTLTEYKPLNKSK